MNDCRHLYNRQETTRKDTAKHALKRCGSANKPAILREKTEEMCIRDRLTGWISDADTAERVVRDGLADFAIMGRALIADSQLVEKYATGRKDEIYPGVACRQGCVDNAYKTVSYTHLCCRISGKISRSPIAADATYAPGRYRRKITPLRRRKRSPQWCGAGAASGGCSSWTF